MLFRNISLVVLCLAICTASAFGTGCSEPEGLPDEFLEQFERAGNLEALAPLCSGAELPMLPGIKSGWIKQNQSSTTLQFSNLGLQCDEELFIAKDGRNLVDTSDCNLPSVAWWDLLSFELPPLDEVELGKPYLQEKTDSPFGGPRHGVKLVHPGQRGCGLMVANAAPEGPVSVVIEARTPTCVVGRISGVGWLDLFARSKRYLLSPDGRFVAQRCI